MKKFLLIKFFVLSVLISSAQEITKKEQIVEGIYTWNASVILKRSEIDGTPITSKAPVLSEIGQDFSVISINGEIVVIRIFDYENDTSDEYNKFNIDATTLEQFYFIVTKDQLLFHCVKYKKIGPALVLGVINFPFKYRVSYGGDFSGSFNFGLGIGLTMPHQESDEYVHSALFGFSIASQILDSSSVRRNSGALVRNNSFSSFSISFGYLVQYHRVQLGVFVGLDMLNRINQMEYGWIYQQKPWVSVGFGFAVFSDPKESTKTPTNK